MVTPTPPADSSADPVADLPDDRPDDQPDHLAHDPIAAPAPPDSEIHLSAFAELDPVHPVPPMSPVAAPLAPASSSGSMLSAVGPVSGIFFVALFLLSFMVMSTPDGDASDREWTQHWEDSGNRTQGITSALAMLLAAVAFLWLVAALRRRLAGALGTDAFYASGIAAGALMFVAGLGAGLIPLGYELADTPIPDDADLLRIVDGLYFGTVFLPLPYALAGFLIPLFFALRGSLLVPRWLEWATLVVGIVALAGPMLFFVPHALFLLWTLAMSVTLLVRERPA